MDLDPGVVLRTRAGVDDRVDRLHKDLARHDAAAAEQLLRDLGPGEVPPLGHTCPPRNSEQIWVTGQGEQVMLKDMTREHLMNALGMMLRMSRDDPTLYWKIDPVDGKFRFHKKDTPC